MSKNTFPTWELKGKKPTKLQQYSVNILNETLIVVVKMQTLFSTSNQSQSLLERNLPDSINIFFPAHVWHNFNRNKLWHKYDYFSNMTSYMFYSFSYFYFLCFANFSSLLCGSATIVFILCTEAYSMQYLSFPFWIFVTCHFRVYAGGPYTITYILI